eukprot:6754853-Pyramimonas_sp.AAC.1
MGSWIGSARQAGANEVPRAPTRCQASWRISSAVRSASRGPWISATKIESLRARILAARQH